MPRLSHPCFARVYTLLARLGEHTALGRWRSEVLADASGRLLLVGIGPGYDLDHVPPAVTSVVAVDPEPTMLHLAMSRVGESRVPVRLLRAAGERLPFAAGSVDAVLCALVLCTVEDPTAVLAEARRVLRPGGVLLLLEHVRAPDGSRLGRLQDTLTPLWRRAAGGCHLDRRTRALVRAAGFDDAELVDGALATGLPWCLPHLRGIARLPDAPGARSAPRSASLPHMACRRAVVTGGAGFLGSHLCERLLDDGYEVLSLDNFLTGAPQNVSHLMESPAFRLVHTDLTDYVHVPGRVDAVLHFASPASPIDYLQLPIHTLKVGSIGTLHALGLAKEKGARFLLASTSEVYGDPQVHPQPEDYWGHVNPVGPRGVYDEAKRFAEALTMAYRAAHGVDTAIVRIFNTFGPRMRPDDGRAIPTFINQALRGEPMTVAGDGSQTRSVCYVDDLVDGIVRLLRSDLPGPVNVGNPHELPVLAIAELVRDLAESTSEVVFVPRPVDDPTVRQPDITVARSALGWEPQVPVEDGLKRTIGWFRERGG